MTVKLTADDALTEMDWAGGWLPPAWYENDNDPGLTEMDGAVDVAVTVPEAIPMVLAFDPAP